LKQKYGDRLSFHGAIDVQQMLPKSSPAEVKYDVAKRIHDLAPGGGYILSPCHNIGSDVPPENIVAMFEAAQEYGRYPLNFEHVLKEKDLNPVQKAAQPASEEKPTKRRRRPRRT
jgi:uroporphyrinogen decarboxylase